MIVKKIGLSAITVSDIKKSTKFFTDVIGLKISNNSPEFGWCELVGQNGGNVLGIGQSDENMEAGVNAIVSLVVDDISKSKAELESKEVEFLTDVIEVPGEVKLALFLDFDGNAFYLVEELAAKK